MPRYVARRRIEIDGALAFAPGHQVPAGHVDTYNLLDDGLDGPGVIEVPDNETSDRPDLADGLPDTTPKTVTVGERLLHGDPDEPTPSLLRGTPSDGEPFFTPIDMPDNGLQQANSDGTPTEPAAKTRTTKPATGDTTTSTPVTEG